MDNRVELRLAGITYNQIESGVYALILEEKEGNRRMPIIIGYPEAQAIECRLQEVTTPRPLTHDLLASALTAFSITLEEVVIRKLPNGVFAAYLHLVDADGNRHVIDSRSSDAVALAIRMNSRIFTTEEVLKESGFAPENAHHDEKDVEGIGVSEVSRQTINHLSSLKARLARAVEEENYEEAGRLKKEIELLQSAANDSSSF